MPSQGYHGFLGEENMKGVFLGFFLCVFMVFITWLFGVFLEGQLIHPSSPLPEAPLGRDALNDLEEIRGLFLNF